MQTGRRPFFTEAFCRATNLVLKSPRFWLVLCLMPRHPPGKKDGNADEWGFQSASAPRAQGLNEDNMQVLPILSSTSPLLPKSADSVFLSRSLQLRPSHP